MEVWGQPHAAAALFQGKEPLYPLDRRLGGPQSLCGRYGEKKNFFPLPGIELPTVQPVAHRYTDLSYAGSELNTVGSYCSAVVLNVRVELDASQRRI
jgi:hypothetical protein